MSLMLQQTGRKPGIVISKFNLFITSQLLEGAIQSLGNHGTMEPEVIWVPGAVEIPLMCKQLACRADIDFVIALGCVIQGDTPHFDYVCSAVTQGVMQVTLETLKPVVFGILTTYTLEQAIERAALDRDNKGGEAADTGVYMAEMVRSLANR